MRRYLGAAAALSLIAFVTACGSSGSSGSAQGGDTKLVVYSGREEELVKRLFKKFEQRTGITVEVRYGDSSELAATLAEEGGNSPADVFFAQDPGSLGAVEARGMLAKLPGATLDRVPERFRDSNGRWVGTSGRARVVVYNTDRLSAADLPNSVLRYTDPKWRGKIGLPPTNASFQAFVSSMVLSLGEERTRQWLEGIKANDPKLYEKNTPVVEAVAAGEIDVGFVNHYYLYLVKAEQPDAPVANDYLPGTDPGALVSVAGAGILESADHKDAAARFVEYLLSEEGQRFYVEEAEEAEYPLVAGIDAKAGLPPLAQLQGPEIKLDALGPQLEKTLQLLNEVGFTA
jgi:iron(III) transport system substrate-binding protein